MTRQTLITSILLLGLSLPAFAQHEDHPDHAPLQKSDSLALAEIVDSAVANAPDSLQTETRVQQAEAYSKAGDSWLSAGPSLNLDMYNDSPLDNLGLREREWGLSLPLWRPGERSAARSDGAAYRAQVDAWNTYLRWRLGGFVRTALADIENAEVSLALQQKATDTAQRLSEVTRRMFDAGAVARLDVLQTDNLLLNQQKQLLQNEAQLVDAERTYSVLTGLQVRPATAHRETLSDAEEITVQHPMIAYLQSEVAVSDAAIHQSELAARGSPQLTIGTRSERADRFTPYAESVGISLSIPFGGKAHVDARTSSARRDKTDAEVAVRQAQRDLQQALHEAEHELYVTRQSLPLAQQQAQLAGQRSTMAQTAYQQGEITLIEVLAALSEANNAERDLRLLQLREQKLIIDYNQLIGVMP